MLMHFGNFLCNIGEKGLFKTGSSLWCAALETAFPFTPGCMKCPQLFAFRSAPSAKAVAFFEGRATLGAKLICKGGWGSYRNRFLSFGGINGIFFIVPQVTFAYGAIHISIRIPGTKI